MDQRYFKVNYDNELDTVNVALVEENYDNLKLEQANSNLLISCFDDVSYNCPFKVQNNKIQPGQGKKEAEIVELVVSLFKNKLTNINKPLSKSNNESDSDDEMPVPPPPLPTSEETSNKFKR